MARLIKSDDFFCKWLRARLLQNNKNVLGAEVGPTGSGKSYRDLRKVEMWYKNYLNRPFPVENICFGVVHAMSRLTSGELKRGDILIFEEAGANLGSLDFQNRVSKMFTYVLQSFRSMNVGIFFNLPYLSMLNKQARMLLHYSSESLGIDFRNRLNSCKFFFHQVNQRTGKIYPKYPRVRVDGQIRTLKSFSYEHPSEELAQAYEDKKQKYLMETTAGYLEQLKRLEYAGVANTDRKQLTEKQQVVYDLMMTGMTQKEVAAKLGITQPSVADQMTFIRKKGYKLEINGKPIGYQKKRTYGPISMPP